MIGKRNLARTSQSCYLSETEAMERVRDFESRYSLFDFTVDGYSVWRLLRVEATRLIQNLPWNAKPSEFQWLRPLPMMIQTLKDLPSLLCITPARYVIRTCSSFLVSKEYGRWKDVFFDDLFKNVDSYFKIAVQNGPGFQDRRKKTLLPISITNNSIDLFTKLAVRLIHTTNKNNVFEQMAKCFQSEPTLRAFTATRISKTWACFIWAKRAYVYLLKRIQPEYLLVADTSEYSISAAARELGVKIIEFQHGIFTPDHPDVLPATLFSGYSNTVVPDTILLFGDYWKNRLINNSLYAGRLSSVGSPRIDICRTAREDHASERQDDDFCKILLTTDGLARNELLGFVINFIEMAKKKFDYFLTIKMHPSFDTDKTFYISRLDHCDKIRIVGGAELPTTHELLAHCDLHLSGASTCHFDALGCGVPTVLLPMANYEILMPLVASGHALVAHTPNDLVRIVSAWRDLLVPNEVSYLYYKPNALVNIRRELGIQSQ